MKPSFEDLKRRIAEAESRLGEGKPSPADVMESLRESARQRRGCLSHAVVAAMLALRPRGLANVRAWFHLLLCFPCRSEFASLWPASSQARQPTLRWAFRVSGFAALALVSLLLLRSPRGPGSQPSIAEGSSNNVPLAPSKPDGAATAPMLLASRGTTNEIRRRVAIIVGCDDAVAEAKDAAAKLDPAFSVMRLLTSGGFPETRPTLANIVRELGQLPKSAEGGHLVVFWAGKGLCVNGQAYLLPQDATGDVKTTGLTLEQLSRAVTESKLNLLSRSLVLELGRDTSSRQSQEFLRCLLANPGEWQIVTNAQSWLQSAENTNPEK